MFLVFSLLSTPKVLNLTQTYIAKHQRDVVPLIERYAEEWRLTGNPIYRPMWWLSPGDPATFTIDDQFLIGNEVMWWSFAKGLSIAFESTVVTVTKCTTSSSETDVDVYVCVQVLVAPVVVKGAVQRDIYLPDGGFQWQDSQNARVFDGGTFLQDYPVALEEVAVFLRRS